MFGVQPDNSPSQQMPASSPGLPPSPSDVPGKKSRWMNMPIIIGALIASLCVCSALFTALLGIQVFNTTTVANGPRVGANAPDFTLSDSQGNKVRLADELQAHRAVVLIFYYAYT